MPKYSVVIPCYKSSKSIAHVVSQTVETFKTIGIDDFEFVLVNDCSPDEGETIKELNRLADEFGFIKAVDLGKNVGQHNATMAGLNYAEGDFIISMDDDGQTSPSQLHFLLEKMEEGYDLVYGYYEEKKESGFRRLGSALNHWTARRLLHKPSWLKTSSYWVARKYVRDYAIRFNYPNVHLQGVFLNITSKIACVPIQHFEREYSTSGYTLKKLIQLYGNIVSYSVALLNFVTKFGCAIAGLSMLVGLILFIRKLLYPSTVIGWSSLIVAICFLSGIILIATGIVGLYVGRLYRGQSHMPPQFVVRAVRRGQDKE